MMEKWLLFLTVFISVSMVTTAQSLRSNPGIYDGECVGNGVLQPSDILNEEDCLSSCRRLESCVGIEFFSSNNSCFFHSDSTICDQLQPIESCTHYKLVGCPTCIKTFYGSAEGANCVFPFIYQRQVYTNCTDVRHGQLWCATTGSYDDNEDWGNCLFNETGCPETTTVSQPITEEPITVTTTTTITAPTTSTTARIDTTTSTPTTTTTTTTSTESVTTTTTTAGPTTTTTTFEPITAVTDSLGCTTQLVASPGMFAENGNIQEEYRSEAECTSTCLLISQCGSLSYNLIFHLCFFYFNDPEEILPAVDSNFYVKQRQCPTTTTITTTVTTTTESLAPDGCEGFPCMYGGTCVPRTEDQEEPEQPLFECQCVEGYTGDRCQIEVADETTTTSVSCVDTFEGFEDFRAEGGTQSEEYIASITECKTLCLENRYCSAFDYIPLDEGSLCSTHTLLTMDQIVRAPGVTHYRRVECDEETDATTPQTPTEGCSDTFEVDEGRVKVADGTKVDDAITQASCESYCRQLPDCNGFNFVNVPANFICFIFSNQAEDDGFLVDSPDSDYYWRDSRCITGTTTPTLGPEPITSSVTTGGCEDVYEVLENTFSPNFTYVDYAYSGEECKRFCQDECLGFDVVVEDQHKRCTFHRDEEAFENKVESAIHNQYTRIRCGVTTETVTTEILTQAPPTCLVGPAVPDVECDLSDDSQSCPDGFYCLVHDEGASGICCRDLVEGECEASGSLLISSSDNLYGEDIIERDITINTDAQKTFINLDKPLPRGTLSEFYVYFNAEAENFPVLSSLCLEIWRPVAGTTLGFTLQHRTEVLVNVSSEEGSLCKFDVSDDNVFIQQGDFIGWTNKMDFLPISLQVSSASQIYIRDLDRTENDTVILPESDRGVYVFQGFPLIAMASVGVSIVDPPPLGCEGFPCMYGGTCMSRTEDQEEPEQPLFECQCVEGFTGDRCQIEVDICTENPCINGGTCVIPSGQSNTFSCMCPDGFSGALCEADMPLTVMPPCDASWQLILNRRYPQPTTYIEVDTETACRELCLSYAICEAIEYKEQDNVNCRLHLSDKYLLEEFSIEAPGVRFLRLAERCVPTTSTTTVSTSTTTVSTLKLETSTSQERTSTPTLRELTSSSSPTTTEQITAADSTTTATNPDTTTAGCVAEYSIFPETYVINGLPFDNVTTLDDCKRDCEVQPTCTGFNYVLSGGIKCWQLRRSNPTSTSAPGSTYYQLTSGCFQTVDYTTQATTVEDQCNDNFTTYANMTALGGIAYQEINYLVDCINKCVELEDCLAFDFNKRPNVLVRCFIHTDEEDLAQTRDTIFADLYVINRCTDKCSADLVFVIDSSGSISDDDITNWQKIKDFLSNVVDVLPKEQISLRVAAITFANRGNLKFDFDDYLENEEIQEKLRGLPYGGGHTNTTGALRVMRTELFKKERGDRVRVKNVVVVLTDGSATREASGLAREAQLVRYTGAEIFAIGITSKVNVTQMVQLVTEPFYSHYFRVEEFTQLMQALEFVIAGTCLGLTPAPLSVTVPMVQAVRDTCAPDIALLVDASGSIQDQGRENWGAMKTFLKSMVNLLSVSDAGTHVGAVSFSTTAKLEFRFLTKKPEILSGIDTLTYAWGFTNTPAAFRLARTVLFTGEYGARPKSQDIYILITDGFTNKETGSLTEEIQKVKVTGARILVIGVTNATNEEELLEIASEPQYYHRVENFNGLMSSLNSVITNTGSCSPVTQPAVKVCIADLALLVDSSGSIEQKGQGNYDLIKDFLKSVVDKLEIGPTSVHVGAITFSNIAVFEFGFKHNKADIFSGIDRLTYEGGYTNMTGALRLAEKELFASAGGDRADIGDIILIVTDGRSTIEEEGLLPLADTIKGSGKIIMAVGVTSDIDEPQLLALVSDQGYYHRVEDFDRLVDTLDNLFTTSGCT